MKPGKISMNVISVVVVKMIFLILLSFFSTGFYAVEDNMVEEPQFTEREAHLRFAAGFNGYVWSILGKEDRSEHETDMMVHAAHASRLHWGVVGTPLNVQRGEWLLARVYAVLNRPEQALHHARKCLELTEEHNFDDFDLAYAYEAMARAYAASGNKDEAEKYRTLAEVAGEKIQKVEDRELFLEDYKSEPWYNMN